MKKILIRGGLQEHQRWQEICPCLCEAMGMGGGHIPVIVEVDDEAKTDSTVIWDGERTESTSRKDI